jgi:exosortase
LIPPVSIILFYVASRRFEVAGSNYASGLGLIGLAMLMLILGTAGAEYLTTRVSYVILLSGIAVFSIGWRNFRIAWFPFFFLLFMIPIPNLIYTTLTIPLQLFASKITLGLLHASSVPSDLAGNIIFLPDYPLEVTEACSGLRSLFSLLALGVLVGYLTLDGFGQTALLAVLTIPIAIAANIFRIFVTALLAHTISPDMAEGFLHGFSGIVVFLVALAMILLARGVISWFATR